MYIHILCKQSNKEISYTANNTNLNILFILYANLNYTSRGRFNSKLSYTVCGRSQPKLGVPFPRMITKGVAAYRSPWIFHDFLLTRFMAADSDMRFEANIMVPAYKIRTYIRIHIRIISNCTGHLNVKCMYFVIS